MSIALLDLNDCNLRLWHQGACVQSPGYALLQGQQYVFGTEARATARIKPRDINTRYWWQLSTETLQPALGPARHTGDLAHSHLQELHREAQRPDEMLLAVSGSMQHQQLSLLLGIVQQCPFDVVGLVNRSVALGSLYNRSERLFHLEIQLHQAVISELGRQGDNLELTRTVPLPGCGLLQLQERLVENIAAAFVRQTRFDPRRKADTEQTLYDALPRVLRALQTGSETNIDVNGYQARINSNELQTAGTRLIDSAREAIGVMGSADRIIADPLAALLPGLSPQLGQLDFLQPDDIRRALQEQEAHLVQRGQSLSFVSTLPVLAEKTLPREALVTPQPHQAEAESPTPIPTHLLQRYSASPLSSAGTPLHNDWELYRDEAGWLLRGSGTTASVNGSNYAAGQLLKTGDVIAIGDDFNAVLIAVEA